MIALKNSSVTYFLSVEVGGGVSVGVGEGVYFHLYVTPIVRACLGFYTLDFREYV